MKLILASASPRRKALLDQIGVITDVHPVDIDESVKSNEAPADYVLRLAEEKAAAGYRLYSGTVPDIVVIAADTTVVCNNRILGKPSDREEGLRMLRGLSGGSHQVMTAFSVMSSDKVHTECVVTDVRFRNIREGEAESYWDTGEPKDKAGGYGIQGAGAVFVESVSGSYSNVVGLPLTEVSEALRAFGIPLWQNN